MSLECRNNFTAASLKDIFERVDNQNIIGFIKDAHFYHKLYCSILVINILL